MWAIQAVCNMFLQRIQIPRQHNVTLTNKCTQKTTLKHEFYCLCLCYRWKCVFTKTCQHVTSALTCSYYREISCPTAPKYQAMLASLRKSPQQDICHEAQYLQHSCLSGPGCTVQRRLAKGCVPPHTRGRWGGAGKQLRHVSICLCLQNEQSWTANTFSLITHWFARTQQVHKNIMII